MNVRDCLVLAREDPATLVRTLEVIEMEDRAPVKVFAHNLFIPDGESAESVAARDEDEPQQKQPQKKLQPSKAASARRAAAAAAKSSSGTAADNEDEENDDDEAAEHRRKSASKPRHKPSMRERCFAQLEKSIAEQFALKFKDRTESDHRNRDGDGDDGDDDDDKPQPLPEMLKTAKTLIDDLEEVSEFVAQCFPPAYEIFDFYVQRYQKWLYTRFVARIGDPAEVAGGAVETPVDHRFEQGLLARSDRLREIAVLQRAQKPVGLGDPGQCALGVTARETRHRIGHQAAHLAREPGVELAREHLVGLETERAVAPKLFARPWLRGRRCHGQPFCLDACHVRLR
jgi:hypothetical protein